MNLEGIGTMVGLEDRIKNYYEILEIPYDSSFDKVHEGYIRAKNAYSGDSVALYSIMTKEENDQMLEMIETAYSVLSVPSKRREYDKVKGIPLDGMRIVQEEQALSSAAGGGGIGSAGGGSGSSVGNSLSSSSGHESGLLHMNPAERGNGGSLNDAGGGHASFGDPLGGTFSTSFISKEFQIDRNEVEVSRLSACKRFRLEYNKDPQFEQEIENSIQFNGPYLKKIREYKNVSVERMSDLTKISKTYITQMERDEYEKLPALAYVRGFVYQYAKVLKLGPDLVANSYLNHLKELQKKKRER